MSVQKIPSSLNNIMVAFLLLIVVVVVGTMGFALLGNRGFIDSLYFSLITVSTLGMAPSGAEPFSEMEKVWVIIMITVGIAIAMVSLTIITSAVVEGQIRGVFGRRKVDKKIASLQDHIIVCGYGRMGSSVCDNLSLHKVQIVVIEQDSEHTFEAEQAGLLYVLGDATDENVLKSAGIEHARGVICVLGNDASNVFATLVARDLNNKVTIVARSDRPESQTRLIRAGANRAICPYDISGSRLANIMTRPGLVDFIDFAAHGIDLEADQYIVREGDGLEGSSLREANLPRELGILVIAVTRGDGTNMFNPHPDTIMRVGDTIIMTGQAGSISKFEQKFVKA